MKLVEAAPPGAGTGWRQQPFNLIHQSFLLTQQWWHNATTGLRGMLRQGVGSYAT
jgi:hypothetical protein